MIGPAMRSGLFVERGYPPQKLSSPSQSLYMDVGMVMMPKGGPEGCAMGGSLGSTSATKSDAGVKLGVPTSSRTSLPARIVRRVTTALQPYLTLRPARPNSGTTRARLPCPPRPLPRPIALPIAPPPRGRKPSGGHREEGLSVACDHQVGIRDRALFGLYPLPSSPSLTRT